MWQQKHKKKNYILVIILLLLTLSCGVIRSSYTDEGKNTQRQYAGQADSCKPPVYIYTIIAVAGVSLTAVGIVFAFALQERKQEKKRVHEDFLKTQDEQSDLQHALTTLAEVKTNLESQRNDIRLQLEKADREKRENSNELQSIEQSISESEREKAVDRTEGFIREKKQLLKSQDNLEKRKSKLEMQQMITEKTLESVVEMDIRMREWQKKVNLHMKQIQVHLRGTGGGQKLNESSPVLPR